MFESARIKLTAWYVVIILLISGSFSLVFHNRATSFITLQHDRIQTRLEREGFLPSPGGRMHQRMSKLFLEDIDSAQRELVHQLIFINGLIALVSGAAGYFLSGRTLKPIQIAMDEQKRFVGDAAHELRTPITSLKTSLEVNLLNKKLSSQTKKILKENLEDVNSLESLTEVLLKLTHVDGKEIELAPVNLQKAMNRFIKQVTPIANKKKIKLKLNKFPSSLHVKADEPAFIDLLTILVDNAIKYSPKNSTINIKVKPLKSSIQIQITDQGIGIAKHHQPHIFDRFYRVDPSRGKDGKCSYGLGLSVAQKIVTEHHGSITVVSQLNKGTTFTINLPKTQRS